MTLPIQGIPVTVVSNGKAGGSIHRLGDTNTCGNRNDTGGSGTIFWLYFGNLNNFPHFFYIFWTPLNIFLNEYSRLSFERNQT